MIPLHPQPLRDFDYIGFYYYFLTWCCDHRQPLFTQPNQVDLVRGQFLRAEQETGFANVAYCFMPGYDRVARRDGEPRVWVRYTIENPVRAGLVERVEDYPFTGSSLYSMKELMEFAYEI